MSTHFFKILSLVATSIAFNVYGVTQECALKIHDELIEEMMHVTTTPENNTLLNQTSQRYTERGGYDATATDDIQTRHLDYLLKQHQEPWFREVGKPIFRLIDLVKRVVLLSEVKKTT